MQAQEIPVNPALLQWARIEAGLSLTEAVERAVVTPPRPKKGEQELTAEQRLANWENGRGTPSLPQLEKIAIAYRRPITTFFLPHPPDKISPLTDFRTVASTIATDTPDFSALKRRITILHRELQALAQEAHQQPLPFVGSMERDSTIEEIVANIRSVLSIPFEQQGQNDTPERLLSHLREQAHHAGIFVLLLGNLGSYHTKIAPEVFRGIAIADPLVPVIVINPNDAKTARVFTLVHELAHIWLGASGVSNLDIQGSHNRIERICNAVAAEFLMPKKQVHILWNRKIEEEDLRDTVDKLAKEFSVSGEALVRRLLDCEYITRNEYSTLLPQYTKSHKKQQASGGGPSRNILDSFYLGQKTIRTFVAAAYNGKISLQDASRILGIPVSRFDKVM